MDGKVQTTIRLPEELLEELNREAVKRDLSLNSIINMLLYKGLEIIDQCLL
jgi:Ribbon-helix-helix protein, copG family.